jgi:hypothetical protein
LVVAVAVEEPPKVPPDPLLGAVNVTVTPFTGLPPLVTVACRAVPKTAFTAALCGVPAVAATVSVPVEPPCNAAAFSVTLPVPEVISQVTVKVCPALSAL